MNKSKPLALVAGAGAGLGQSLMSRFKAGGYHAIGLGRSKNTSSFTQYHQVDLSDESQTYDVINKIIADYGSPKIVVHNTAELVISPFSETSLKDYQRVWASMVQSAILLGQATLQPMVLGGGGAFLVSGATASLRGGARFSAFASAKFALRGLTQSLAREYQSAGVHVAHVILDGIIDTPKSRALHSMEPSKMMNAEDIAEMYWQLAHQPRSTWSQEIDLRPSSESF